MSANFLTSKNLLWQLPIPFQINVGQFPTLSFGQFSANVGKHSMCPPKLGNRRANTLCLLHNCVKCAVVYLLLLLLQQFVFVRMHSRNKPPPPASLSFFSLFFLFWMMPPFWAQMHNNNNYSLAPLSMD